MSIIDRMQETVLFVDDEKSCLAYTSGLFENRGLNILTASSALDALKLVQEQSVAVVVSDNECPACGESTCYRGSRRSRRTP